MDYSGEFCASLFQCCSHKFIEDLPQEQHWPPPGTEGGEMTKATFCGKTMKIRSGQAENYGIWQKPWIMLPSLREQVELNLASGLDSGDVFR